MSPGKANVGIIPAEIFREGGVGLVSRSGTLTYQIGHELTQLGLGNSTIVGIGGDPVVGSSFVDVLERFEADPETELVVMVGEIGGDEEEKAAKFIQESMTQARARLHRGLLGAARQDHGTRGRDHLRLVRNGPGQERGARGLRRRGRHDADRGRADGGRPEVTFRELHEREQLFVMPNPWDVGSAKLLASMGFEALATTSAGFAWSIGTMDQRVTRGELVAHVATIAAATDLPLNVDSERCYPDEPGGVAETARLLAEAGAAGFSIEDWDPASGTIDPVEVAAERVAVAAAGSLVVTARAENHIHGIDDFDDTLARLVAYRDAGADVVYAPGLTDLGRIATVVETVGLPVNVLALQSGPTIAELASVGVRRVSTGSALTRAAYGALYAGARELLDQGTSTYSAAGLPNDALRAAFE